MQIINFTEPLIKPALQDKSKCTTFRKAWDWLDEGQDKKACWREQTECRHKVGALETIMWMQRGKTGLCENCIHAKLLYNHHNPCANFSKGFGVGKILQTSKVWMDTVKEEDGTTSLIVRNNVKEPLEIITEKGTFFNKYRYAPSISRQDGFKNPVDFKNFFLKHYSILLKEPMPFWRIKWDWQK